MAGLLDIAPVSETVKIRGTEVDVYGISAKGIAQLLGRFPELRALMSGVEVKPEKMMAMVGDAMAPVIAAGCGQPGDKKAELAVGKLSAGDQLELVQAVLSITFPKGLGPLLEKVEAMGGLTNIEASPKAQGTNSQSPLNTS